ncbi:MAG: GntR family transcriptional regulator [Cetobacterium sp.]|uniref:GntR family transcriptional regulator n=2 Tax=Cetobacterium sp. TaxID=2071632 RepID=UPI003F2E1071
MSKSLEVENYILNKIENKEYLPENKIISENEILRTFNISRMTARKAIQNLVQRGYLYQKKGSGTYVSSSENKININFTDLIGFTEKMETLNIESSSHILEFKIIESTSKLAEIFNLEPKSYLYRITRLRFAKNEPLILERTFMPLAIFGELEKEKLIFSKYKLLNSLNLKIDKSIREFFPIIPPKDIQELLKLPNSTPIFKAEVISTLKDGRIFEFSKLYYNQNRCSFKEIKYKNS